MADPAVRLREKADRDEAGLGAHVEPVVHGVGHRDEVAGFAEQFVDLVADVQGEQARAGDEEAHLVLLVEVLVEELRAHLGALRVVGRNADDIHAAEAALGDEAVDVAAVGVHDALGRIARLHRLRGVPALEAYADRAELLDDRVEPRGGEFRRLGRGFVEDAQAAHGRVSVMRCRQNEGAAAAATGASRRISSSQASRNSKASR